VLSGVPRTLPSLVKAYRISQKAASAGFDWETKEDIWSKVQEEISEVQAAMQSGDEVNKEEEFGDLLFALVNAARLYGVNAETALEKCNKKFISRFTYIEEQAEKQGLSLRELSLAEMENWWCEAKNKAKEKTE
jgi:MazG family protein